jgi:hypothetical protein
MFRPLLVAALAATLATPAEGIPAFARRYGLTCMTCHDPVPKLSGFGEQFLARGYRLSDEDTSGATSLGDPLLSLQQSLPLAIRLDAYVRAYGGHGVRTDFATPMIAKLLSGGTISSAVSYYVYLLLAEDGATGPIEDAWVAFRRPFGLPATLTVGQFQIADPVWKRELRLTIENYQILSQRIGEGAADVSYDRGVMLDFDLGEQTTLSAELVNGNGIGEAPDGVFDGDAPKAGALWAMRRFGPVRVGGMAYYGSQRLTRQLTTSSGPVSVLRRNHTWMAGPALQVTEANVEVNAQYIWRGDTDPTFDAATPDAQSSGGFAEIIWWPLGRGGRFIVTGLYNRVASDAPGAQYEAGTVNLGWLLQRNLRLAAEGTWDFISDRPRAALGFVTAF